VYSIIDSYRGPAWLLIDPPLGTPTTSIHTKLFHRLSQYRLFWLRDFPQEPSEALLNEQCLNGAKDHGKNFETNHGGKIFFRAAAHRWLKYVDPIIFKKKDKNKNKYIFKNRKMGQQFKPSFSFLN
jgi:hypothetical protein